MLLKNIGVPVVNKEGYYYYCELSGNGIFGELCVADITCTPGKWLVKVIRPVTYRETCRLCDAHEKYIFGYTLVTIPKSQGASGMLLRCSPYGQGVSGRPLAYPNETKDTYQGGNCV